MDGVEVRAHVQTHRWVRSCGASCSGRGLDSRVSPSGEKEFSGCLWRVRVNFSWTSGSTRASPLVNPIKSVSGDSGRWGGGVMQMHSCAPAAPVAAAVDYTITGGRFVPAIKPKTRCRIPVNVINIAYVFAQVVWRPPADAPTGHVTLQFLIRGMCAVITPLMDACNGLKWFKLD